MGTKTLAVRSLAIVVLGIAALVSLRELRDWLGDWAALLWTCATMFFPWVAGMAAGHRIGVDMPAKLTGAAIGFIVVIAPLYAFAAMPLRDVPTSEDWWMLAGLFAALGAVLGGMALPVGVRVRSARRNADA
ncbi:MAG: hypothetical protein OXL97_01020 [Chloroflexota bacterium]|nr:hypothetical protein [Chloroflexota bacterium]MDE2884315.1 hypothetical protein [Chloroflexota bacterium]